MADLYNEPRNSNEMDLNDVSRKMRGTLSRVNDSFFDGILFIKRNIIILLILLVAGIALGYYLDRGGKKYEHTITVIPNFNSTDYLYAEIDLLNAKIKDGDHDFLRKIGVANPQFIGEIEVEPIVDIYPFINSNNEKDIDRNFEIFRILSETGKIDKVLADPVTSKYYKSHLITITTGVASPQQELIDPVLAYLNSSSYYKKVQGEAIINLNRKIAANDTILKQIDGILNNFGKAGGNTTYYNLTTEVDKVIYTKDKITIEQGENRINKINFTKIVKDSNIAANIRIFTATSGLMKFIIPSLLIIGFILVFAFRSYYKSQIIKRNNRIINE